MSDQPTWQVKDGGSFASVCVALPPGSGFHCESDAVVTMSQSVDVRGDLPGGVLGGLARAFLTRESFFTTKVRNVSPHGTGDALVAPSDPGGIALHRLVPGEDVILTAGAYLAADEGVQVSSSMRSPFSTFGNYSGTGVFHLNASGRGTLAICAYGSMHRYVLAPGETRNVDNGHIVAWTASMRTTMKLASARAGIVGSMTSGEGVHCEFVGPGVVYVQSHKPRVGPDGRPATRNGGGAQVQGGPIGCCIAMMVFLIMFMGFAAAIYFGVSELGSSGHGRGDGYGYDNRHYEGRYRPREL